MMATIPLQQSTNFHRLVDLHINCGADVLRQYFVNCVAKSGKSVSEFLNIADKNNKIPWGILYNDQSEILRRVKKGNDPGCNQFDVTLASLLIINTYGYVREKTKIKELRKSRNRLFHLPEAEVNGTTEFNEVSSRISELAGAVSKDFQRKIQRQMTELRNQEWVRPWGNMEKILLNGEVLMMKLVETSGSERVDHDASLNWIKLNMHKWIRQLSRLKEMDVLLNDLKEQSVINGTTKRYIEEGSSGDQMPRLIISLQNEIGENILKFCKCLRRVDSQLADLVENQTTDGRDTEQHLQNIERSLIQQILEENLQKQKGETVSCEEVHILVEEKLDNRCTFDAVRESFQEAFSRSTFKDGDKCFVDVTWKNRPVSSPNDKPRDEAPNFREMGCETFADYLTSHIQKEIGPVVGDKYRKAIVTESIRPTIFIEMTEKDLQDVFTEYLQPDKFGFGHRKTLSKLQNAISDTIKSPSPDSNTVKVTLRGFDELRPERLEYKRGTYKPVAGNLLVPVHEFRQTPNITIWYAAKEVVQFVAACMNGRKNGTIHFGIKLSENGNAVVVGVSANSLPTGKFNEEIEHSIKVCFPVTHIQLALRCTRGAQVIPIEKSKKVVVEIDVVPSSYYLTEDIILIKFPPMGVQTEKIVTFNQKPNTEMIPIDRNMLPSVQDLHKSTLQERTQLELDKINRANNDESLQGNLATSLKGFGNKYVTDEFVPVLILGNLSGTSSEEEIRQHSNIQHALLSTKFVLDFDVSTHFRKEAEGDMKVFDVRTADDFSASEEIPLDIFGTPTWIYCNGNEDLSHERLPIREWMQRRQDVVKQALGAIRKVIPRNRARVIFLIFSSKNELDPIFEIAREALVSLFRDECIVIAQNPNDIQEFIDSLKKYLDEDSVARSMFTGLDWQDVFQVMNTVFRQNPNVVCKLPHSNTGHFVEMTVKEKEDLGLHDLEILSVDQCERKAEKMRKEDLKICEDEVARTFYKGGQPADWWNFFFTNHVGERIVFTAHRDEIEKKLKNNKGEYLFEVHTIEHHPGSGGSTLGRHLLWHFSQTSRTPNAYRCCIINRITDTTVDQIEKFRNFKDDNVTKPFIVLVDNEDMDFQLKSKLNEAAYKTAEPGHLYCVLIVITRVSLSNECPSSKTKHLLTHKLKGNELIWFENKYKELEKEDVDVETLIAFNVMRRSFDKDYLAELTEKIMKEVNIQEEVVLKTLSLINTFDSDHPIPHNVFDKLMGSHAKRPTFKLPFGISRTTKEIAAMQRTNLDKQCFWRVNMSNAMSILITKRVDSELSGISIISQPLARAILNYIIKREGISLVQVVDHVLDRVEEQARETNLMAKKFIRTVCRLFKTRQTEETEKGEAKLKFSDLVLELERQSEGDKNIQQDLLKLMKRCFQVTDDAMVGQQLARFNIHIREYKAAEEAIQEALRRKPYNSYIIDTYGQIYKSRMEQIFEGMSKTAKVDSGPIKEATKLAIQATEKFKEGQEVSINSDDETNVGCFHMEVKTAMFILEKIERFERFERKTFLAFLNDPQYKIEESPYLDLCPENEPLRCGTEWQVHLENSLRRLEDESYQIKKTYVHSFCWW